MSWILAEFLVMILDLSAMVVYLKAYPCALADEVFMLFVYRRESRTVDILGCSGAQKLDMLL